MRSTAIAAALVLAALGSTLAQAADYHGPAPAYRHSHGPRGVIGMCLRTRVAEIGSPPGSAGPLIRYQDGVVQDFDGGMLGHAETRPGDPIQLCLVSFSRDCGEEDLPGRTYATGNLRTGAAWTSPDVRSSCTVR